MLVLPGCGGSASNVEGSAQLLPPLDLEAAPLTVEIWQQHTGVERFAPEIIRRLRAENPQFQSKDEWTKFTKEVLDPAFTEEMGQPPPVWK